MKRLAQRIMLMVDKIVRVINHRFNGLHHSMKRTAVLIFGALMGGASVMLIVQALVNQENVKLLKIQNIKPPKDIFMEDNQNKLHSDHLIPVGKYKGEIDGQFEAFYLAVDIEGKTYMNREPDFSDNAYLKSKGWKEISREELNEYRKHLHFIPSKGKGLKP